MASIKMESITATGMVKTIRFQKENFYIFTIIKPDELKYNNNYRSKYNNHLLLCKGRCLHPIKVGDNITITGYMKLSSFNNEYTLEGKKNIEKSFLITKEGFMNFLGTFKGLGPSKCKKIAEVYNDDIKSAKRNFINDIVNDNQRITNILKGKTYNKISTQVLNMSEEQLNSSELEFIQEFEINASVVKKIKQRNENIIEVFQKNPYEMAITMKGIGFIKVDNLAKKIKNKLNVPDEVFDKMRIPAGIYYTLIELEKEGHSFLTLKDIKRELIKILKLEDSSKEIKEKYQNEKDIKKYIQFLIDKKSIQEEDGKYYLHWNIKAEINAANIISKKIIITKEQNIEKPDIEFKFDEGFIPSKKQMEGLEKSLISSLMILTGGPGTGKTSIAKYIYQNLKRINPSSRIKLMAPTGTAARRISQVIGCDATTIHRGIKHNGVKAFYDQTRTLPADIIIIDESSMIDLNLLNALLNALDIKTKVIFIGDVDQLPSVGVGNVLDDMQKAGVPTVKLDRVYRQNNDNPIVDFAYDVNKMIVNYYGHLTKEMKIKDKLNIIIKNSFNKKVNPDASLNIENTVIDTYFDYVDKYGILEVQILSQLRQGGTGSANSINKRVQSYIHEDDNEKFIQNTKFKVGDKVIQTRNNNGKKIFNGSMGFIKSYNKDKDEILIEFIDGSSRIPIIYKTEIKDLTEDVSKNIDLAYAITIHKSQGNEWKAIVLNMNNYFFINKKLIYTAVTRAREKVSIITNHSILTHGIKTQYGLKEIEGKLVEVKRNSFLSNRIILNLKEN